MTIKCPGESYTFLRQWLSRYRIYVHTLRIESWLYTWPVTSILDGKFKYFRDWLIEDEKHFIHVCEIFKIKRQYFFKSFECAKSKFWQYDIWGETNIYSLPPTVDIAKCVSKFLGIMTNIRRKLTWGWIPMIWIYTLNMWQW